LHNQSRKYKTFIRDVTLNKGERRKDKKYIKNLDTEKYGVQRKWYKGDKSIIIYHSDMKV